MAGGSPSGTPGLQLMVKAYWRCGIGAQTPLSRMNEHAQAMNPLGNGLPKVVGSHRKYLWR